jgi:GntR family transcriptional regulator of arabinose operon
MMFHSASFSGGNPMSIDRNDHTPLYLQFYQLMKQKIVEAAPGDCLPPERLLCQQYGLDRVTVRKALAMLVEENLIERKQGRGTRILHKEEATSKNGNILFALYHGSHLVDRLGEPFYARSLDTLEQCLHQYNERLVYSKIQRNENLASICKHLGAKGVILAGRLNEEMEEQCRRLQLPRITYNSKYNGISAVLPDNESGAALAAKHLLQYGHRSIGFIHVPGYTNSETRLLHFSRVMKDTQAGCPIVVEGDWTEKGGYQASCKLLDNPQRITAIFAGNDSMALGILKALDERGLKVPQDISVIGFDGIAPPLTTLQIDISTMANAAHMLLFYMFKKTNVNEMNVVVPIRLIDRGSTGPVPSK